MLASTPTPTQATPPLALAEVFPGWPDLAGRLAARSLVEYQRIGAMYLAWCATAGQPPLVAQSLRQWRHHLVTTTNLSPHTINMRTAGIKTLVRASAACGAIDRSIAYDFSLVERVRLSSLRHRLSPHTNLRLTPADVRALCRQPDASTLLGLRDRCMLHVLASSGIRIHELVSLTPASLLTSGQGHRVSILGKGQATARQAPLSTEAFQWCQTWLTARRDTGIESPWLLTAFLGRRYKWPSHKPLATQAARVQIQRYARQIGLPHFHPHHLRKFVGSALVKKYDLRVGQKALGHVNINTFTTYYLLDELPEKLTDELF